MLYDDAIELEIEFFSAQLVAQPSVIPLTKLHDPAKRLVIFCDFDESCSMLHSSEILAQITVLAAQKADDSGADNAIPRKSDVRGADNSIRRETDDSVAGNSITQKCSSDMRSSWEDMAIQYAAGFRQCIENLFIKEAEKFDYEGLCKGLKQVADFEKQSNSKVVESGMLSGVNLDYLKKAGERCRLRRGCSDYFQKVVKRKELNIDLHILSYCWCANLIRSAFTSVFQVLKQPRRRSACSGIVPNNMGYKTYD